MANTGVGQLNFYKFFLQDINIYFNQINKWRQIYTIEKQTIENLIYFNTHYDIENNIKLLIPR